MNVVASLSSPEAEAAFLESIRSQYEEKGYTFTVHPPQTELPEFFSGYIPDAIARRPGSNIAIEVKSRPTVAGPQLKRIRKLFEGRKDWQLTVAYVGSAATEAPSLPVTSRTIVLHRLAEAERLIQSGDLRAAFMVAWSLLEASLNSIRPDAEKRPRSPGSIVQFLAMEGLIPKEREDLLRRLGELRNRVVHGDLTVEPSAADVRSVLAAIREVLG